VRIASHPSYPNRQGNASLLRDSLRTFCQAPAHAFWKDEISLRDQTLFVEAGHPHLSHVHLTDVYLLGLAVNQNGKLATFDTGISTEAVRDGMQALTLLNG
jgi:hypothetical protein